MEKQIRSLRLEKVVFGYEGRPAIFEDLNLDATQAPLVWLHGAPGLGKSSLLKILAGLVSPQSGHYWINDVDVLDLSFKEFLPYRLCIGYSFDTGGLLSNRTLYENLILPLLFHKRCAVHEAHARVMHWLERFDLARVKDLRPFAVTGGQRKSTVLLRSLIHHPQIVLLDDATSGLKQDGLDAFYDILEESMERFGLKHILFCGESELKIKNLSVRKMELSRGLNSEAA